MSAFTEHIGGRIRLYRRQRHLTLAELAARISKSKASVSKYESGAVGMDADTLLDVARALGVAVCQLTDLPVPPESGAGVRRVPRDRLCLYAFDGRRADHLLRGFIELEAQAADRCAATLFLGFDSFAAHERCMSLYFGEVTARDTVTNYMFINQQNDVEQLHITAINPLGTDDLAFGLITGINNSPLMPIAFKCVLAPRPLPEDEELRDSLRISEEDLRDIRRGNMFMGRQQGRSFTRL